MALCCLQGENHYLQSKRRRKKNPLHVVSLQLCDTKRELAFFPSRCLIFQMTLLRWGASVAAYLGGICVALTVTQDPKPENGSTGPGLNICWHQPLIEIWLLMSTYNQKLYCHFTPNCSSTEWFLCMMRNLWINYLSAIGCLLSLGSDELSCYSDSQNHCPLRQMSCNGELGSYYPIKMQGWYCHWHSVIRIPNTWYYWSQTNSWHKADRWLNFGGLRIFGFLHFLHKTLSVCAGGGEERGWCWWWWWWS